MTPQLCAATGALVWGDGAARLTPTETALLACLARSCGAVENGALLALFRPHECRRDRIGDPKALLRTYLWRLRRKIGGAGLAIELRHPRGWCLVGACEIADECDSAERGGGDRRGDAMAILAELGRSGADGLSAPTAGAPAEGRQLKHQRVSTG